MNTANRLSAISKLLDKGYLDTAAADCIQLVKEYPDDAVAWVLLSEISARLKQHRMAVNSALKALSIDPDNSQYLLHLARLYSGLSAWQASRKVLRKLRASMASLTVEERLELALLYYQSGQIDGAIELYQQVINSEPDNHQVRYNLASLQRYTGDLNSAAANLETVIAAHPEDYEACSALAHVKPHPEPRSVLEQLTRCQRYYEDSGSEAAKAALASLYYGKGKVLEDARQYPAAFAAYATGAALKRDLQRFKVSDELARINAMQRLVSNGDFAAPTQSGSDGPLFIVGMPRTGTTVVEGILGSHSEVKRGGELNYLPMTILEATGGSWADGPQSITAGTLANIANADMNAIGQRYMALSGDYLNCQGVFTDKLPLNALFVPIILSAIPNARVVQVERNAMDTALSNFKMLFKHGYDYSYSLDDIGAYVPAYQRMIKQWQETYPQRILTLRYEHLVAQPEEVGRRLTEFCELPWEPACLQFHQQPGATQTASASQVTESLHNRYVGQWRRFKEPLTTLKKKWQTQRLSALTEEDVKW